MYMCLIPNGLRDRAISLYSTSDLTINIFRSSHIWIGLKRQLAVVTVDSDIVGVLSKIPNMLIRCAFLLW
jgi:hypothetical protein